MIDDETAEKLQDMFAEMSLRGRKIIAQQSETPFPKALKQVQKLKANSQVVQLGKKGKIAS